MDKRARFHVGYLLLAFFGVLLLQDLWQTYRGVSVVPYSKFEEYLDAKQVKEVFITENEVRGELKEEVDDVLRFATTRVDPDLAERLDEAEVTYTGVVESNWFVAVLSWVLPVMLFFGLWLFLLRRMGSPGAGMMSVGKSKAKIYVESDTEVSFADVAGVDEAKHELEEIVTFLKDPQGQGRLGARMPKGVLLVGPPGTGKTLLARAVAGEAGVPFFSISGSEFVEMFVGVGAARVRDLFEQARQKAPCILFIDELDALGRVRSGVGAFGGGHDEKEQTLNQLLVELDGFDPTSGIVLLAATNRPEILDPALLRAGRFDRQVLVDRPDKTGRVQILRVHVRKVQLDRETDLTEVAALTPGFTGADLANLVNEAALVATRRGGDTITLADFTAAIERIVAGLEKKSRLLNPFEREVVAHHEMGHALVAAALPGSDPVHKVSIIPRGIGALGYTIQRPTEDRFLRTKQELEDRICVLFGGRAAEAIVFDHTSTGAADDLSRVTDMARAMVTRYAMVPSLGQAVLEDEPGSMLGTPMMPGPARYSQDTAREIDCAVREILERNYERASKLLTEHRAVLDESARELLAEETLTADQLRPYFDRVQPQEEGAG